MHHHGAHPNAATPAVHVAGAGGSPNHAVLTRNNDGVSNASQSAVFQRHHNIHGV
jgi:hypothetical protein